MLFPGNFRCITESTVPYLCKMEELLQKIEGLKTEITAFNIWQSAG